jgi:hypothetical protein
MDYTKIMEFTVFWDVMLSSVAESYHHFGGICCHHFQGGRASCA